MASSILASPSLSPSFSALHIRLHHHLHLISSLIIIIILHLHFQFPYFIDVFHVTPYLTGDWHFYCSIYAIFVSSEPPVDPKNSPRQFLNFRHFGRFRSTNSDLVDSQAGANCETSWRVTCMFTQRHIMPMTVR